MFEEPLKRETRYREIAGILMMLLSIILLLSLGSFHLRDGEMLLAGRAVRNLMGPFGAWLSGHLRAAFGLSSYLAVALLTFTGWEIMRRGTVAHSKERFFAILFLIVTSAPLIAFMGAGTAVELSGGAFGIFIVGLLESVLRGAGAALVLVIFNIIGLILLGLFSVTAAVERARSVRGPLIRALAGCAGLISKMRRREKVPYNNIEESVKRRKNGRLPWVTKKTLTVHGASIKRREASSEGPVLLLPLQNPVYDGAGGGFEFNDYRNAEESLFNRGYAELVKGPGGAGDGADETGFSLIEAHRETKWADALDGGRTEDAVPEESDGVEMRLKRSRITGIERDAEDAVFIPEVVDDDGDDACGDGLSVTEGASEVAPHIFDEIPINRDYIIPVKFLYSSSPEDAETFRSEIRRNSELLVNTLKDFGIDSRVVKVNRGPVITLYEMQIAPGIKVNRIVGLSDDIALALAASRVRIVAPIPGKSAIGVEVPNLNREMVTLGDIIKSPEYSLIQGKLKVALGKDILGTPVTLDIKKLPHLLIAGATGSGKSVCVNSIITSLIYNYGPNHVRFILVDPKMVELMLYNGLPHLLTPVITEPHVAPRALKWATVEMERRYRLLSAMNTRDIDRYNEKAEKLGGEYEKLPYIVVIMDELADLMMIAAKEIEGYITRIAQKARAVGIHLVLATQRPSVDVITGIIKANFPARIAFQVAQKTDSRTILDQNGAEKLLGKGDMLYQSPMSSFPVRIQGAFISEDEVMSIVQHLRKLAQPRYIDIEEDLFAVEEEDDDSGIESDGLFREALKIVEETKKASASYLQRRLSIGYNRAARMIELMEEKGYVGPQQGSKPREVYL